jgi:hypothetical protein
MKRARYFETIASSESEAEVDTGRIVVSSETAHKPNKRPAQRRTNVCIFCLVREVNHICQRLRCAECFQPGHVRTTCRSKSSRIKCTACGSSAHLKDSCPHACYTASLRNPDLNTVRCLHCKKRGHVNCSKYPGPLPLRCFVCCDRGHSGSQCRERLKTR